MDLREWISQLEFKVDPNALDEFSADLRGLANDARKAESYINKYAQASDEADGIFLGTLYQLGINRITDAATKNADRLGTLTGKSGAELAHCADVYRETDKRVAAVVDATYPKQ